MKKIIYQSLPCKIRMLREIYTFHLYSYSSNGVYESDETGQYVLGQNYFETTKVAKNG